MMCRAMNIYAFGLRLARKSWSFAGDQRGISAVEFALLLPLMVTLYLGGVEISQGISADRKVTLTTRSVGDLASRVTSINNADMTNIMNAGKAVMLPYSSSNLKIVLSSVKIDGAGNATIVWSDTMNGTAHGVGQVVNVPAALKVPNTWLIWSEIEYSYTPVIGYVITGTLQLKDNIYMRPRLSDSVARTAT
jgi:Flp pilus assembly protein TadG